MQPARSIATGAATALFLAALITGFYWKITLTDQYTWLWNPDNLNQVLPWYQFQAAEWQKSRPALWDPNHWMGQPLAGQGQPGAVYPLNWILFALPLRDGWIQLLWLHWYFVVIHIQAAWFAYLLAQECGVRRIAAVLGGVVFSLAGWMGENEWPSMLNGAVWAPLVFLYLLRVVRAERVWRSAILGGFFLGVAWLSGHHQVPMFVSLATGAIWLYVLIKKPRLAGTFACFWATMFAAGAMQILPAIEYGRLAVRWVGAAAPVGWQDRVPYDVHRAAALPPIDLIGIVIPGFFRGWNAFLGVAALTLIAFAVSLAWRRIETRLFSAVGLGALLYALGDKTVFQGVFYSLVPFLEKARAASLAVLLFNLAGAGLAAIGLESLLATGTNDAWTRRVRSAAFWFSGALMFFLLVMILVRGWPGPAGRGIGATVLVAALVGVTLEGLRRGALRGSHAAACFVGLFLVESSNSVSYWYPKIGDRQRLETLYAMRDHSDIADYLRRQQRLFRVETDPELVKYNFGDWHGVHQLGGYLASATENVYRLERHTAVTKHLLGVEYLIAAAPTEFHSQEVFRSVSGLKVLRNSGTLPRAFAVHEVLSIPEEDEPADWIEKLGDEAGSRSFVRGVAPALDKCDGRDEVLVREYTPGEIRLRAQMACRGMVILTDTWFPGWVARVDGIETKIWQAYGAVRGVVVEKGGHEVEFRYRPSSVWLGGLLSALAGAVAIAAAWLRIRWSSN